MDKNVIFISLDYFEEKNWLKKYNSTGISVAHHLLQNNIIDGLKVIDKSIRIQRIYSLPVASYPNGCPKLFFKSVITNEGYKLGLINFPIIKHITRKKLLYKIVKHILNTTKGNIYFIIYDIYLPFWQVVFNITRKYKRAKTIVIIPDIPGKYCIEYDSYPYLLKIIKNNELNKLLKIIPNADAYVVLTEAIKKLLKIENKPCTVIEGMVANYSTINLDCIPQKKIFTYAGELNKNVGLQNMIEAFKQLEANNIELWICGNGEMSSYIEDMSKSNCNIKYWGFVTGAQYNKILSETFAFINPRQNIYEYTKYSFPSKNLEYLKTGKPVIAYKLDGIPNEYDPIFIYPYDNSIEELKKAMQYVLNMSIKDYHKMQQKQIEFIKNNKLNTKQCQKILELMEKI